MQTFIDVSDFIPTSLSVFIASGCSGYCSSNSYNLNYSTYNITGHDQSYLYGKVKNAVNVNHPSIISVWNSSMQKGHWMVSLGWREYNSTYKYIQVLNGWEDSDSYFFRFQSIPLVSVTDYSIATYNSDSGEYVTRLYTYCFSRDPDLGGLISWVNVLLNNIGGGGTVAHGFFFSQEYLNLGKSNAEYISDLYHAMLGRSPDSSGLNNWLNALNSGYSREWVLNGFANSVEFSNLCDTYGIVP